MQILVKYQWCNEVFEQTCKYLCSKFLLGNIHNTSSGNYSFCSDNPVIVVQLCGKTTTDQTQSYLVVPTVKLHPSDIIRGNLGTKRIQIALQHGFNSFLTCVGTPHTIGTIRAITSFAVEAGRKAFTISREVELFRQRRPPRTLSQQRKRGRTTSSNASFDSCSFFVTSDRKKDASNSCCDLLRKRERETECFGSQRMASETRLFNDKAQINREHYDLTSPLFFNIYLVIIFLT